MPLVGLNSSPFDEIEEINVVSAFKVEKEAYSGQPLIEYIQYGTLPTDLKRIVDVKQQALRFIIKNDTLYRKAFEGVLVRCLSREEATYIHAGICSTHQAGPNLVG